MTSAITPRLDIAYEPLLRHRYGASRYSMTPEPPPIVSECYDEMAARLTSSSLNESGQLI